MRLSVLIALLRGGLMMSASYGNALGGKPHRAYVFLALRQASFAKRVRESTDSDLISGGTAIGEPCAPITLRGLSASVKLPVETCRAVVEVMVGRGICNQTERGLVATEAAWTDPYVYSADNAALRSLSEFVDALEAANSPLADTVSEFAAEAQRSYSMDRARLLTPWIDFVLRQLEIFIPLVGDGLNAIIVASIASVVFRRSERLTGGNYIEAIQSINEDSGVRTSEIAVVSGLARETVRRRLTQLEERGILARGLEGRWLLDTARSIELSFSLPLLDDCSSAGSRLMREIDRVVAPVGDARPVATPSFMFH